MSGNTFGSFFRVTTWGESHGRAVGAVVDGCPPNLPLTEADIQKELDRRRPGCLPWSSPRDEKDLVEILSGTFEGRTTGTPISLVIRNRDADSAHYDDLKEVFRPGHGDYTYCAKYGIRDHRGGGRASARETASRVAAGAVAKKVVASAGIQVIGYTRELGGVRAEVFSLEGVEANDLRCPDSKAVGAMVARLKQAKEQGDSVGGVVEILVRGCP
ncbi:MAG: chorismate synthase, partial [Thermodesulfobacteriota bacterium]